MLPPIPFSKASEAAESVLVSEWMAGKDVIRTDGSVLTMKVDGAFVSHNNFFSWYA